MSDTVIPAVLDRHVEEAAFLWLLRDRAVVRPQYTLATLAELDLRVEAHLDGLRVAGEAGSRRAWEEFETRPEPGEAFTVAVLAFEEASADSIQKLLDAVEADAGLTRAVVSAVGWLSEDSANLTLPLLHAWGAPGALPVGLAGAAIRRTPVPHHVFEAGLREPKSRARAIKAVAELADFSRLAAAKGSMTDPDLDVRFVAAWTVACLRGDTQAVAELQNIALVESRYRHRSADISVRRLHPSEARRWIEMRWEVPGCERVAIQATGALGDPALVSRLLERTTDPAMARLAAEALALITGMRLAEDKLDADQPKGFEAGPTDDPEDALIDLDPDDGLDWPDPEKVSAWWTANRGRFPVGIRHICGRPISTENLNAVLRDGYQRQRAAAALELAVRHPHERRFEVRAPGWRQRVH